MAEGVRLSRRESHETPTRSAPQPGRTVRPIAGSSTGATSLNTTQRRPNYIYRNAARRGLSKLPAQNLSVVVNRASRGVIRRKP